MSTGRNNSSGDYYDFSDNDIFKHGYTGSDVAEWWRKHSDFSNDQKWEDSLLTSDEKDAIGFWTASGYARASDLYDIPWDNIDEDTKEFLSNLYNGINKFELKKGITVNRATDFQIFGQPKGYNGRMTVDELKDYLKNQTKGGLIQVDGFMSFSSRKGGVSVASSGLVIELDVPPNKGMGAYVSGIGENYSEQEFMTNNNAILKFDWKSVRNENGNVHVKARLMGRAEMQTIDPKNNSALKKKGGR